MVENDNNQQCLKIQHIDQLISVEIKKFNEVNRGQQFLDKLTSEQNSKHQPVKGRFVCLQCLDVVIQPKKCKSCEKLFCSKCIDKWTKLDVKHGCPNCRSVPFKEAKVSRFELESLNELEFKCY